MLCVGDVMDVVFSVCYCEAWSCRQGCTFYSTARHCRVSSASDKYLSNLLVPVSSMLLRIELLNNQ